MRTRITKKFCASSKNYSSYQKITVSKKIELVTTEKITKTAQQPYVKVFGKLLPLSREEVIRFSATLTIIWL